MVPAAALAAELARRGHRVALVSDERGVRFPGLFDGVQTHVLPAGRLMGGPLGWTRAGRNILAGRAMARELYRTFHPEAVTGFGGDRKSVVTGKMGSVRVNIGGSGTIKK